MDMEEKRLSFTVSREVYERMEEIREKRQPMSGLIEDMVNFAVMNHGSILLRSDMERLKAEKDAVISDLRKRMEEMQATIDRNVSEMQRMASDLGRCTDELRQAEKDFREMRDDRNNIASVNRILHSTIDDMRKENDELRSKLSRRRLFSRSSEEK
jgi:chromosome segregation ATPase